MLGFTAPNPRPSRAPGTRAGFRAWRVGLCAGVALGALTLNAPLPGPATVSAWGVPAAHAQTFDRATQALFLAVDRNDLPGVQAAIDGGADIEARDFNGMQAVDMAIERGYFDIAHYLISMRNRKTAEAQGTPVQAAPSPDELAERAAAQPAAPEAPATPPDTPAAPPPSMAEDGAPSPFDQPRADGGLPVIGDVREAQPVESAEAQPGPETDAIDRTQIGVEDGPPLDIGGPPAKLQKASAESPSAAKTFVTTFMDFFRPPNTTGIVRGQRRDGGTGEKTVTDEDIAKQLQELDADGNPIKGPAVPISPEELATEVPQVEVPEEELANVTPLETSELPPYSVQPPSAVVRRPAAPGPAPQTPEISSEDAFGDLQVEEAQPVEEQALATTTAPSAADSAIQEMDTVLDASLPFGGGVDPDILRLLGMEAPAGQDAAQQTQTAEAPAQADPFASDSAAPADPFASDSADPFAQPQEDASVSGILESIDKPQEVTELKTHKPTPPGEATDPFAEAAPTDPFAEAAPADPFAEAAPADPFATPPGEVDELAGLLESSGEDVNAKPDGWDVKDVESGTLPDETTLASIEPTGAVLDGAELALGLETTIGQPVGEERMAMLDIESIHKPCITKGGPETVYCVDAVSWPFELEEDFLVDTIMYQGTRAIGRYDAGSATRFHALFRTEAMARVIKYYTDRYGPPSEKVDRAIAPLAQPRRDNPTYIWRSREPGTDTITVLEIRQFDDARGGGFPDTKRGVIMLYRQHAGNIFPQLSQLELMVLKESGSIDLAPKTPDSVW